jgi:hypothetical protein
MKLINYTRPEQRKQRNIYLDTDERGEDYLSW